MTSTPSAINRRACSRSCPGTSRPDAFTTRHHGTGSSVTRSRVPTARAARGKPAAAATSPKVVTSPGTSACSTAMTRGSKSGSGTDGVCPFVSAR
jgi:hypothetical protein